MNLPTTTSEITASWMTEALRASDVIGGDVAVSEISVDPGAVGVGFMGEIATVGLTYDGDANGAPTSVIAKFPTQSPEVRAMMQPARIYEREHRFYREIAAGVAGAHAAGLPRHLHDGAGVVRRGVHAR